MLHHPAFKMLVKDIQTCSKNSDDSWDFRLYVEKLPNITRILPLHYVWIQGYVEQLAGKENEILIIRDISGKVKVAHCSSVPGGSLWISKGIDTYFTKIYSNIIFPYMPRPS